MCNKEKAEKRTKVHILTLNRYSVADPAVPGLIRIFSFALDHISITRPTNVRTMGKFSHSKQGNGKLSKRNLISYCSEYTVVGIHRQKIVCEI
jgi:hypothetical protein